MRCSSPPISSVTRAADILAANATDLAAAAAAGMEPGPLDRLRLTDARLAGMAAGLRTVAALPDPVGDVLDGWQRPNGLLIERVRVPARRRRDHLREPAQRHERCSRALPEVGKRRVAPGFGHRAATPTARSRRCSAKRW